MRRRDDRNGGRITVRSSRNRCNNHACNVPLDLDEKEGDFRIMTLPLSKSEIEDRSTDLISVIVTHR